MAKTLQFRRGSSGTLDAITGAEGEIFVDLSTNTIRVHDGSTEGGVKLATESFVNNSAFDGDYNSLSNTPTIPADVGDLTDTGNVLFDGDYESLSNKPTIPADVGDLTDTGNVLFDGDYESLSNKPTIPADVGDLTDTGNVLFDGDYNSLTNKPDLSAFDNVEFFNNLAAFPMQGESDKVYIANDTGFIYRWGGMSYIQLTDQTAVWGSISGTLSNQMDLSAALNAKLESADIANFETTTQLNNRDTANRNRSNHTGTQAISTVTNLQTTLDDKQSTLVSGTNIKTINNENILGSGDIEVEGGVEGLTLSNGVYEFAGSVEINGDYVKVPEKTTTSRPGTPEAGMILFNTEETKFEGYDGTAWQEFNTTPAALPPNIIAYAWGRNSSGQLGDGTTVNKSSPVTVIGGITNWSQISTGIFTSGGYAAPGGTYHSLGSTTDGIAYAWGNNSSGQLGDGTTVNRSSPVTVIGGITNWSQTSAGSSFNLGITTDGIAYAWGRNVDGGLGDGTTINRSSPVTVIGGITNWSQVSAGYDHSLGLTDTGVAYAWGGNNQGSLGNGEGGYGTYRSSPVTVAGGLTWSQVSAGGDFCLGVTTDGIAYAWGDNYDGTLGNGEEGFGTHQSSPVTVIGGITNWSQVSAGSFHSLGVTDDGIAYAWGFSNNGLLGNGTGYSFESQSSPVTVIGGITNWSQVSAGDDHSLGLTDTGVAYAWGGNNQGSLGDDTTANRSSPVTVIGGITNWTQLSGGQSSLGLASS